MAETITRTSSSTESESLEGFPDEMALSPAELAALDEIKFGEIVSALYNPQTIISLGGSAISQEIQLTQSNLSLEVPDTSPDAGYVASPEDQKTIGEMEQLLSSDPEGVATYQTWIEGYDAALRAAAGKGVVTSEFREEYIELQGRVNQARRIDDFYDLARVISTLSADVWDFIRKVDAGPEAGAAYDAIARPVEDQKEDPDFKDKPVNPEVQKADDHVVEILGRYGVVGSVELLQEGIERQPSPTY